MIKLYDEENNDGVLDGYIFIQKNDLKEVLGEEEYTEDYTEDDHLSYEGDNPDTSQMLASVVFTKLTGMSVDFNYATEWDIDTDTEEYTVSGIITDEKGVDHNWEVNNSEEYLDPSWEQPMKLGIEFLPCAS